MFGRSLSQLSASLARISILPSPVQRFSSSIATEYKEEIADILKRYEFNRQRKQALVGTVVSTKCPKTLIVRVVHKKFVSKYGKFENVQRRIMVHDEEGMAQMGDLVRIIPCLRKSKMKRHAVIDIVNRPPCVTMSDGTVLSAGGNVNKR